MASTTPTSRSQKAGTAAALVAALAAGHEGYRSYAYYDPPGVLTVCAGHTGPDVKKDVFYSKPQCDALLEKDAMGAVKQVDACVPDAPMTVLVAFGDAAFNLGPKIACDKANSTAARLLAAKDWVGACQQLPRWDKARIMGVLVPLPGLTKRRADEMNYCLKGFA
jgi:GH24 family phage-related lysozyme (muramidase)